jgi:hypothetical protein
MKLSLLAPIIAFGFCGGVVGCNEFLGIHEIDDGHDGGVGARGDAGVDASVDAGAEASVDAGAEASVEAGAEASVEAGADGGIEASAATEGADGGCFPRPSGILSWWRAEGDAMDFVGPNNGTLTSVTFVQGVVGQAFHFNGPDAASYVVASAVNLPLGSADRTAELWVRLTVSHQGPVAGYSDGLFFGYGVWGTDYETFELAVTGGGSTPNDTFTFSDWQGSAPSNALAEQAWHHVATTWSNGTLSMYVDGALANAYSAFGTLATDTGSVYIGGISQQAVGTEDPAWLGGDVDEVTVYSRALSAGEIQGIYAAGSDGKCH